MIIKKNKSQIDETKQTIPTAEKQTAGSTFVRIEEREERRRGDRRRGYRRIDDRNLISRAHEEAGTIKEIAAKEGFEYGLNQAKEEINKLNETILGLSEIKEIALNQASNDIAFIAINVAEKIIKKEVETDKQIILNIISDVLKQIGKDETNIIIKTNASETQLVRENIPQIYPYGNQHTKITVIEDEQIEEGCCIVETKSGMIDAKFDTQLQILMKAFKAGI